MIFRDEQPADIPHIARIVTAAFETAPFSDRTEAAIVDGLRNARALAISLVAVDGGELVGHVVFSPVTIGGVDLGWFGLGPVAVRPNRQGSGIGQALVRAGLARLIALGAKGSVVLGEPEYYGRFGFRVHSGLWLADVPSTHFMALTFGDEPPSGQARYHAAFSSS